MRFLHALWHINYPQLKRQREQQQAALIPLTTSESIGDTPYQLSKDYSTIALTLKVFPTGG